MEPKWFAEGRKGQGYRCPTALLYLGTKEAKATG
jgi:hypothetical protein